LKRRRPVPSHGFDLAEVALGCAQAIRLGWRRQAIMLLAWLTAVLAEVRLCALRRGCRRSVVQGEGGLAADDGTGARVCTARGSACAVSAASALR